MGNALKQAQETYPPQTHDEEIRKTYLVSIGAHVLQPDDTTKPNLSPLDCCRHEHRPGSIPACFAAESRKQAAPQQQSAKLPTKDDADVDQGTHLQQAETDLDCHMSLDNMGSMQEFRQASTSSKTRKTNANSQTKSRHPTQRRRRRRRRQQAHIPRNVTT